MKKMTQVKSKPPHKDGCQVGCSNSHCTMSMTACAWKYGRAVASINNHSPIACPKTSAPISVNLLWLRSSSRKYLLFCKTKTYVIMQNRLNILYCARTHTHAHKKLRANTERERVRERETHTHCTVCVCMCVLVCVCVCMRTRRVHRFLIYPVTCQRSYQFAPVGFNGIFDFYTVCSLHMLDAIPYFISILSLPPPRWCELKEEFF